MEYNGERVAELIVQLQAMMAQQVTHWIEEVAAHGEVGQIVEQVEALVRTGMQDVGRQALEGVVESISQAAPLPAPICPACGKRQQAVRYQDKQLYTLLGTITVPRRYYRCAPCGESALPLDAYLGLPSHRLSRPLEAVVCQLGAELPFVRVQALLRQVAGVALDDNTIQRAVTRVGNALQAQQQAAVTTLWEELPAPPDNVAPTRLYLTVDGTTVHCEDGWKEIKVAALYETEAVYQPGAPPVQRAINISYVTAFAPAVDFAQLVYVEAVRRGLHTAQEVVVLADGAPWIWNHIPAFCDDPVEILDYYHARQHLWQAAHARYGEGTPQAHAWVERMEGVLFEEGPDAFLHCLFQATHEVEDHAHDVFVAVLRYFTTHRHRIDYTAFRQADYHIGSGTVESACKRVIGARLKQAGMRWSQRGAQAVATLRATILSERWDDLWPTLRAA